MENTTAVPLTAGKKPHYEVLDGLRGIAALAIVIFHFCEWAWANFADNPFGHGYLAVDFFFCLSGFVIAYAYDERMKNISYKTFFVARLIRLHPLVILGSVLGLLAYLLDPFSLNPYAPGWPWIALTFFCSLFLAPLPGLPERAGNLFPLNAPAWSLFMEYLANVVYAFVLSRLHKVVTLILAIAAAIWLAFVAKKAGGISGGWSELNMLDGLARVSFSFLAGLVLFRFGWILKNGIGFIVLSILLLGTFMFPYFSWNWAAEALVVILVYPLIVALGAGTIAKGWWSKCCVFLGRLSYPLYMTHYAAIWMFGGYFTKHKPGGWQLFAIISIGTLILIGFSYLVMRFFDEPVRAYLNRKYKEREEARQA